MRCLADGRVACGSVGCCSMTSRARAGELAFSASCNPPSHCCGRLRIRAPKKRRDPASGGVNPCVLTNKTRRE
jgi:hypothetical protein